MIDNRKDDIQVEGLLFFNMICKICNQDKTIDEMKPYRLRNGIISHRQNCKSCYNKRNNQYESVKKTRAQRDRSNVYFRHYIQLDTNDLVFIKKTQLRSYWCDKTGIIYSQNSRGFYPCEKRLGARGYLEFKMGRNTYSYKHEVAKALIPNPKGCNKVYSKNANPHDTSPENLKWIWTREKRIFTLDEARKMVTDNKLIEYYNTGDKRYLKREIDRQFEKIYHKCNPNFISDLYLTITNYGSRNLLFNLENDFKQTYFGLIKQSRINKNKIKTQQINEKYV